MSKKRKAGAVRDAPGKRSALMMTSAGLVDASTYLREIGKTYVPLTSCPEVRMCVHAYADMISNMTIHLLRNTERGDERIVDGLSRIIDVEPNRYQTRKQFIYDIVHTMMLEGDGNAVIIPRFEDGYLREMIPVPPSAVIFVDTEDGGYKIVIGGREYDPSEVIHIAADPSPEHPYIGSGTRVYLRDIVRCLSRSASAKASVMESPIPSLIVKVDGLTDEYADPKGQDKLSEKFDAARKDGKPWYIPAEAFDVVQIKPLTMTDLAIRDNIELDRRSMAAMFGVPAFMVGVGSFDESEYNNFIQSRILGKAKYIEQALTRGILYSSEMYLKFNPRSLYNYQLAELIQAGGEMVDRMAIRRNEWRDWIGLPPDKDMDELLALENYIPADKLGEQKKLNPAKGDE